VHQAPDDEHVGVPHPRHGGRQPEQLHHADDGETDDNQAPPPPSVPAQRDGRQRGDAHIDAEEPHRLEDDLRRRTQAGPLDASLDDIADADGEQQYRSRREQPVHPAVDERGVAFAALLRAEPAAPVRVATDEEEQGNDLEHPRQRPQSRGLTQRAAKLDAAAAPEQVGNQPVADDDRDDAAGPQQVQEPVAGVGGVGASRRARGLGTGDVPMLAHAFRLSSASPLYRGEWPPPAAELFGEHSPPGTVARTSGPRDR
jgi:hypothetical protein